MSSQAYNRYIYFVNVVNHHQFVDSEPINSPLQALSKMVPVPESLMSPDYRPSNLVSRNSSVTPTLSAMSCALNNKSSPARIIQPVRSPKSNRSSVGRTRSQLGTEARKAGSPSPARQKKTSGILK